MNEPLRIRLRDHGPLVIESTDVQLVDAEGNAFELPPGKANIALCRCGQSSRRPFCDGTHRSVGFHAPDRAC